MQTIAKDQLLTPGICTICECAPDDGQDVVDTLKNLQTPFPFKLRGRKYVCASCIVSLGNVVGLVSSDQADKAVRRATVAEAQLAAVQDHVVKFAKQFEQTALETASNVSVLAVVAEATPEPEEVPAVEEVAPESEPVVADPQPEDLPKVSVAKKSAVKKTT